MSQPHRLDQVPDSGPMSRLVPAAAAAIFDDEGRVLLTRRADNGLWCLPSGRVEVGESVAETVVRETLEETGLVIKIERATGLYSKPHPYAEGRGYQVIALVVLATVAGGSLRLSSETTEFGYFPPDELPQDIVPTHIERILDAADVRRGGEFKIR